MRQIKLCNIKVDEEYYNWLKEAPNDVFLHPRYSLKVPVVINTDLELIDGNHRLIKAQLLGRKILPCKVVRTVR